MDNLTRDAVAAQKAGISYGKYKALHPFTGEQDPEEAFELDDDRRQLVCAFCGKQFVTDSRHANRMYCDDVCQRNASNRRSYAKKQGEETVHRCAICGKEIDNYKGRLYCGSACREEANRIRNRERQRRRAAEREGT